MHVMLKNLFYPRFIRSKKKNKKKIDKNNLIWFNLNINIVQLYISGIKS